MDLKLESRVEVLGSTAEGKTREVLNLLTQNVCSGGAFFHTDHVLPVGMEVKVDLVLELEDLKKTAGDKALIEVRGRVLRCDPPGLAICFDKKYKITPV